MTFCSELTLDNTGSDQIAGQYTPEFELHSSTITHKLLMGQMHDSSPIRASESTLLLTNSVD